MNYEELTSGCLFHASSNTELEEIQPAPSPSYENKNLVFAARHPVISAVFLHNIGKDITCRFSVDGDVPVLNEQYAGAYETRYPELPGAIYIVPARLFLWAPKYFPHPGGGQRWPEDYVCEYSVKPIEKILIPNVRAYLEELIGKGRIRLNRHTEGKTLEDRLAELYARDSSDYRSWNQFLSSAERIQAEIERRNQVRT